MPSNPVAFPATPCSILRKLDAAREFGRAVNRDGFATLRTGNPNADQESPMFKSKQPRNENLHSSRRRESFERNCQCVISGLYSVGANGRTSGKFGEALAAMNGSLFAMAYYFLRSEPSLARRRDLAEEARQIWHAKMLAVGFKSYLTKGEPFGRPFGRYAIVALLHICVSLRRGRDRIGTLASLDGFSDPRRDPRDAAEHRDLKLDCRKLMARLPSKWQELLRLLYVEGCSNLEAADRLRVNPQTVANWHLRSRKRLRDEFRRRGYWPP
jgi:RNA polymerase sigma factor (sigma-70 family)